MKDVEKTNDDVATPKRGACPTPRSEIDGAPPYVPGGEQGGDAAGRKVPSTDEPQTRRTGDKPNKQVLDRDCRHQSLTLGEIMATTTAVKRGAHRTKARRNPLPRSDLAAARPHVSQTVPPPNVIRLPKKLSFSGNNEYRGLRHCRRSIRQVMPRSRDIHSGHRSDHMGH